VGEVTISIRPALAGRPGPGPPATAPVRLPETAEIPAARNRLSPVEKAVLEVLLEEEPQTPEGIARQTGYALRTVRVALTALCRAPVLAHRSAKGYTRA
jgi:hypothetical protein